VNDMKAPPPLRKFDAQVFRELLASPACSSEAPETIEQAKEFREQAEILGIILASHYSDDLDRLKLWTKIDVAVGVACAKSPECDPSAFLTAALDNIKADPGKTARDKIVADWLRSMEEKPHTWREGFIRYLVTRRYAILVYMRRAWGLHVNKGA